ncbi:MAG: hypothetical protein ABSC94_27430 [Polyangiaceae bacterium]|jgi:hypothetical protein
MSAREAEAWSRAQDGGDDDLIRLDDLIGCDGARERGGAPALRMTALHAMAYCPDFSELPWLAEVATTGDDAQADSALDSIVEQASRPRRTTDPEDAKELGEGCRRLLTLARASDRPRVRRVVAVRALRMLAERGCVQRSEIPHDFDADAGHRER